MCKFIQQNLSQVQQDLTYLGKPPKENDKKLRTLRELSKKIENPPPLISNQFQPLYGIKNPTIQNMSVLSL